MRKLYTYIADNGLTTEVWLYDYEIKGAYPMPNKIQFSSFVGVAMIIGFAILGAWLGTPAPSSITFGEMIAGFSSDTKTRLITLAIVVDVILGICAAVRIGIFDAQQVAKYHATNVLPYIVAYFFIWSLAAFGISDPLPTNAQPVLLCLSFGTIATSLVSSIANNVGRMNVAVAYTSVKDQTADTPNDVKG